MSLISVNNVSKVFRHHKGGALLRDHVRHLIAKPTGDVFHALRNVSFEVAERESVALIGANGAGKSTMLALVCGLAYPDTGTVEVRGSLAPLLELGSGFHPDLTGRENLLLNAAILGMSRAETEARIPSIIEFSELSGFIDEPLRTYSAGMVLRLAFSIATHCDPAILIIDEVLGVGDANFQRKCQTRIQDLRAGGKTFLCVSHSPSTVRDFCDRAIWLHHGEVIMDGPSGSVVDAYTAFMDDPNAELPPRPQIPLPSNLSVGRPDPKNSRADSVRRR